MKTPSEILAFVATRECPLCDGKGRLHDDRAIGEAMKAIRVEAKLSLRKLALRMNISAPYLSDLERGNRGWSEVRMQSYMDCLTANFDPFEL